MRCLGLRAASQRGRTECVPPRKPAFAPSPGLPLEGLLPIAWPSRGGAGSARPQGRHHAKPNVASFWPRPPRQSVGEGDTHWLALDPYSRTHGVRPSEKIAFRAIPGFLPRGHVTLDRLSRRGGLRTPANEASLAPRDRPIGPPGVHLPPMIMLCPGLLSTRIPGRTECVPPRKPPCAPLPGPRSQGRPSWDGPPRRGGLRTPVKEGTGLTEACAR